MRLTEEKIAQKRLAIIDKGCGLMLKQGYGGTGISEIAKEVGMPKGSFFNYFQSKEDFVIQTLHHYTDKVLIGMQKTLRDENLSPLQRLKKYYRSNVKAYTQTQNFKGGCFLNILSLEMSDHNSLISDTLKICFESLVDEIAHCIQLAQEANEIDKKHDPKMLATFIDNSWRGYLTTSRSTKDKRAAKTFVEYVFDYCLV